MNSESEIKLCEPSYCINRVKPPPQGKLSPIGLRAREGPPLDSTLWKGDETIKVNLMEACSKFGSFNLVPCGVDLLLIWPKCQEMEICVCVLF